MSQESLLQFFAYGHLPAHLQEISKPFGDFALHLVETLPRNPERTTALRKLLEAKDCAVRASLFKTEAPERQIHAPGSPTIATSGTELDSH